MKWKLLVNTLVVISFMFAQSSPAFAACSNASCPAGSGTTTCSKAQVLSGVGQTGVDCSGKGVDKALSAAVNILSIIVGAAAVIMIIASGLRYISSGGDSTKVSGAKTALIYALVGVAIAALAQLIVHFILYQSSNAAG